jgi:hypothetical protein
MHAHLHSKSSAPAGQQQGNSSSNAGERQLASSAKHDYSAGLAALAGKAMSYQW